MTGVDLRLAGPALSALAAAWITLAGAYRWLAILAGIIILAVSVAWYIAKSAGHRQPGFGRKPLDARPRMENCAFWNGLGPLFIAIGLGFTLGATGAGLASYMARVEIPASEVSAAEKPTREVSGREAPGRAQTVTVYGTLTENARAYRTPWGEESCQASVQPRSITFSTVGQNGTQLRHGPRARLRITVPCGALRGQTITATGRLSALENRREAAFLRGPAGEISGTGTLTARAVAAIDSAFSEILASFPAHARGLLPGVALGDESEMSPSLDEAMKTTSLAHLTAVSGGHVSILTGIVLAFLGRRYRVLTGLGCAAALAGLVTLVGTEPSVLRAALMGIMVIAAMLLGKNPHAFSGLAFAILFACALDPWLATSYGFLLSASATGAIVVFGRPLAARLSRILPAHLADLIVIPLVAQLAVTPILALFADRSSMWGVLANILVAPIVTPLTILGLLAAITAPVAPAVAKLCVQCASLCTWWLAGVAETVAEWPGSGIPIWAAAMCEIVMLIVVALPWRKFFPESPVARNSKKPRWQVVIGSGLAMCILAGLLLGGGYVWRWASGQRLPAEWEAIQCDVGQGSAFLARKNGAVVMVDVGLAGGTAAKCVREAKIDRIDLLILSHYHADHVRGLAEVMEVAQIGEVWTSLNEAPRENSRWVKAELEKAGIPYRAVRAPAEIRAGRELFAKVLSPRTAYTSEEQANADSFVVYFEVAGGVLVLSDTGREVQDRLISRVPEVRTVIVAHHGSRDHSARLARELAPEYALISVGENSYGHPHPSVYESFAGAQIIETLNCGRIAITSEGPKSRCG
ncbi:ComEC/Rec2 family competence protein [Actinobaculum suis]|uniref:ComEC/Rec2 family competence protein n=1 Tax=Actinobaculum suis TaxID=1657 RepID=UPI0008087E4C|nr:ComEC/Rec2 family competence protein [Actinobaculum suis]OCA93660.1 hypothetical protein ACU20_08395 [Actinobaculum suis]OCA94186.1 hypothetical protein ACU21_08620 [Actinobaculum suis]